MSSAGTIISGAGLALSVGGQIAAGFQQRRAARANARALTLQARADRDAAELEAQQLERTAVTTEQDAEREGAFQRFRERRQREQQRFLTGQIIAQTAGSGLLLEGSPLFVLQENERQTELGILVGRAESEAQVHQLRQEAQTRRFGARVTRFEGAERLRLGRFGAKIQRFTGEQAFRQSLLRGAGTLLTGSAKTVQAGQLAGGGGGN